MPPASIVTDATLPEPTCPSCGARRLGPWCAACGERLPRPQDLDLRHFLLKEIPHELFEFDGKLPRTLRLLFTRPGALAVEFVAGRRRPYVTPLRLYVVAFLFSAFLAFLFAGHAEPLLDRIRSIDPTGLLARWAAARTQVHWDSPELREALTTRGHWLSETGTMVIFLLVALIQQGVFRRQHRRYLEHVVLALTVASFYILLFAAGRLLVGVAARAHYADLEPALQNLLGVTALPIYWFLSIRRFYGLPRGRAALGALLVTGGQVIVAMLLNFGVAALLIATA